MIQKYSFMRNAIPRNSLLEIDKACLNILSHTCTYTICIRSEYFLLSLPTVEIHNLSLMEWECFGGIAEGRRWKGKRSPPLAGSSSLSGRGCCVCAPIERADVCDLVWQVWVWHRYNRSVSPLYSACGTGKCVLSWFWESCETTLYSSPHPSPLLKISGSLLAWTNWIPGCNCFV